MTMTRTLGGNRLGSGKKMSVEMKTYERSTHDLSYLWRSTMAPGTLVPFMSELGLPGDTFDINLDCDIQTHPTVGPLFGSFKVQLDVFMSPIRLYQAQLHNNKLGIGLNMANIKLPQIRVSGKNPDLTQIEGGNIDNSQINPSSILSYLNIRGIGIEEGDPDADIFRDFNGIPYLSYWDIYKNYYANKQEEIGAVIHNEIIATPQTITLLTLVPGDGSTGEAIPQFPTQVSQDLNAIDSVIGTYAGGPPDMEQVQFRIQNEWRFTNEIFGTILVGGGNITLADVILVGVIESYRYATSGDLGDTQPQIVTFPLSGIDTMREAIMTHVSTVPFLIAGGAVEPYGLALTWNGEGDDRRYSATTALEGLGLKTYQSDLFNNWIQTEWLDGTNGINEITAIDTSSGSFTIDTLNLSKKVYDMLNRIAISGGTYDDWLDTVYTHDRFRSAETPIYMGGLIKELVFQEVVSNAESGGENSQPLGTLAGKGKLTNKHKGGKVTVKVDEPCYIMGIISLTPRLDYSQGNKWDMNLKTMDDLHKPALDEIGFQDLITDQMAWWDTRVDEDGIPTYRSAGKQPAWINYMTNVNQVRGNFAVEGNEMFMTLNRKYEPEEAGGGITIKDLTTYIDPIKFNDIFAQTSRDAQNFWTQIAVDITARRKMSARIIPNL